MKKRLPALLVVLTWFACSGQIYAANPGEGRYAAEEIRRGTNLSGLTGLFITNSAYTVRDEEMVLAGTAVASSASGTNIINGTFTVTYGLANSFEIGLATGVNVNLAGGSGMSDTELSAKWRFRSQSEYLPAMGFSTSLILPTGSGGFGVVDIGGLTVRGLASSESQLSDTIFIGLYVDVGISVLDTTAGLDGHYELNLGGLMPISDDNHLQLIGELNYVTGKAVAANNYTAATFGARYNRNALRLGAAVQAQRTQAATSVTRAFGSMSLSF